MSLIMTTIRHYSVEQLQPYIDWAYFLHAWQMPPKYASAATLHQCPACRESWVSQFGADKRSQAHEALSLVGDALRMLDKLSAEVEVLGRVGLFEANSKGDDIVVVDDEGHDVVIPCLRQQVVAEGTPNRCMADFVRPLETGVADRIGVFATTVKFDPDEVFAGDPYNTMLGQTLCDRLAEAAACVLHLEVRRTIWGYAPDEHLSIADLLHERCQGIRPAVGYPSLPDQSLNFILDDLINMEQLGIMLTENGAMRPHATVTGLMIAYADASYFAVGQIDTEQLEDYAARRALPIERVRQFLAANLSELQ